MEPSLGITKSKTKDPSPKARENQPESPMETWQTKLWREPSFQGSSRHEAEVKNQAVAAPLTCLSIMREIASLEVAPTTRSSSLPPLKRIRVGIPLIP